MSRAALLAAVMLAGSLTACTTVTIVDRGGATTISRDFGFIGIELGPQTGVVTAEVASVGYHRGPLGMSLGFNRTTIAAGAPDCRLIVWLRDIDDAAQVNQLLGKTPGLCIANPPREE